MENFRKCVLWASVFSVSVPLFAIVNHSIADTNSTASWTGPSYLGPTVPTRPREAFDLAALQAATLQDLRWVSLATRTDTNTGVRIIDGEFSPGPYTARVAPPGTEVRTVTMKSAARVYVPTACRNGCQSLPVLVFADHVAIATRSPETEAVYVKIADAADAMVVVHGESNADPQAFGYRTEDVSWRDAMVNDGLADLAARNACRIVDLQTSNYSYFLARTNMLALTLGIRLLEAGNATWNGRAGLSGSSKEGYAAWIIGAVDDRFQIINAGGFQRHTVDGFSMYEYNSGCGPNGARAMVDIPWSLAFRDWLKAQGQAAQPVFVVAAFPPADIQVNRLILHGDVGMVYPTGYAMHDSGAFTIAQDTAFLTSFRAVPHRYFRLSQSTTKQEEDQWRRRIRGSLAKTLVSPGLEAEFDSWGQVVEATAADDGGEIKVSATVQVSGANPYSVELYWAHSPNREFHDLHQAPWNMVSMRKVGSAWEGTFTPPTTDNEVAWYVQIEESVALPGGTTLPRADSSPIQLLRELPKLSCTGYVPICSP